MTYQLPKRVMRSIQVVARGKRLAVDSVTNGKVEPQGVSLEYFFGNPAEECERDYCNEEAAKGAEDQPSLGGWNDVRRGLGQCISVSKATQSRR